MTWHLKDRELEKKLISIDSGFPEKLDKRCEKLDNNKDGDFPEYIPFVIGIHDHKIKIILSSRDVEKCPEYNPNTWNEYPNITPPKLQPMKIEFIKIIDDTVSKVRSFGVFYGGCWFIPEVDSCLDNYHYDGMALRKLIGFSNLRFRSWED